MVSYLQTDHRHHLFSAVVCWGERFSYIIEGQAEFYDYVYSQVMGAKPHRDADCGWASIPNVFVIDMGYYFMPPHEDILQPIIVLELSVISDGIFQIGKIMRCHPRLWGATGEEESNGRLILLKDVLTLIKINCRFFFCWSL